MAEFRAGGRGNIDASEAKKDAWPMDTPPPLPDSATPPPLPVVQPSGFKLGWPILAAWGLYAVIRLWIFVVQTEHPSTFAVGEFSGELVASFVIPLGLAALFWRLCRRSFVARDVTFFVVLGIVLLGHLNRASQRQGAMREMHDISTEQREVTRRAVAEGKPVDPEQREKLAQRTGEQFDKMAQNSSGAERAIAEACKAFTDKIFACSRRYEQTAAAVTELKIWNLEQFEDEGKIESCRKTVQAFMDANAELTEFQDMTGNGLRRELVLHKLSQKEVEDTMNGYFKSATSRMSVVFQIRETDRQIGEMMMEYLNFVEANRTTWTKDDKGLFTFATKEALKTYNDIITRVNQFSAGQAGLKKQLIAR